MLAQDTEGNEKILCISFSSQCSKGNLKKGSVDSDSYFEDTAHHGGEVMAAGTWDRWSLCICS